MEARLALLALALTGCIAPKPDRVVILTVASHEDRQVVAKRPNGQFRAEPLETVVPGLGVEWGDKVRTQFMLMSNSFDEPQVVGTLGLFGDLGDDWAVGVFGGGAYNRVDHLFSVGGVALEKGPVRVLWMPDAGQVGGAVTALQFTWGF